MLLSDFIFFRDQRQSALRSQRKSAGYFFLATLKVWWVKKPRINYYFLVV